jgi:signal transduction histidine kinase/CheY-like chemotaxis protein
LEELRVSDQLRELERNIISAETKLLGAAATGDSAYLTGVEFQIDETQKSLESLKKKSDHDSTLKNIRRLSELANVKLAMKKLILDSLRARGWISPMSFRSMMRDRINRERQGPNEINDLSWRISNSRQRLLDSVSLSINNSGRKAHRWGNVLIVVVILSGTALFWFIISRIRKQNHLIEQLDASEKKVKEVSMIKENFMANMSHEIRTPMNAIIGFTNLLRARNRDPELNEFVESIRGSGENLLTIINEILDLSKIEAGMMRIESAPFSVRQLVHSLQTLFIEKISEKGLQFIVNIEDNIPDTLSGDATRLTQILVNVIGNAVKFTNSGEIELEIKNKGLVANQIRLEFIIRDTGIGMEKEKLSGIFERFRQAEDSITRKYGGTGLGLSIVKELVLLQNGEIKVKSEPGKGTSFGFILPFVIAIFQVTDESLHNPVEFDPLSIEKVDILVVEDNVMNQNLLGHLLKGWKLPFRIVNNGIEAIEILQTGSYNLVLMDIQMPGMDGYTATEEIRQKLKLDIPIIAMTAHAFAGEREKCLSYGMSDYIAKPLNEKELGRLIRAYFGIAEKVQDLKKHIEHEPSASYQCINLQYMRDISDGNSEFERTVTEQFIEVIPVDVEALESAFINKDLAAIRQTAHNMKTNISIMGLSPSVSSHLDELESQPFDELHFQQIISLIKNICQDALMEARHFYSTK